jgi:hypothetical protein
MFSAAARQPEEAGSSQFNAPRPSSPWQHFAFSSLSHHGRACCNTARAWLVAMDFAQLNGGDVLGGPRWLGQKYNWGPSPWPMHWCDAVDRKVVDCGVQAAFAHEAFSARGVKTFRAQFIQQYSASATDEWRRKWREEKVSAHWIGDDLIYHEGNAVLVGNREVKLWDASAGSWINPRQSGGYGSLVAVRIFCEGDLDIGDTLRWGDHSISINEWHHT